MSRPPNGGGGLDYMKVGSPPWGGLGGYPFTPWERALGVRGGTILPACTAISATESEILRHLSVRFLTRKDCHLCDEARAMLTKVAKKRSVLVEEIDIDTDDELARLYGLRVPVILDSHDQVVAEGVIDDQRLLSRAIEDAIR